MTAKGRHIAARPDARPKLGFRPDVEGLRAVAVLLVVAYHAGLPLVPGGYVGVDVFFVLSGFLITGLLLREMTATSRISLRHFYARRVRRLLPAATLTMAGVAVASAALLPAARAREIAADGIWTALFGANLRFARTGTDYLASDGPPSPLQHYWSLAVEEQFYLAWPFLILAVAFVARRHVHLALRLVLVCLVAGSLVLSVHQTANDATWAYFSPFTRAWELGAGALVAVSLPLVTRLRRTAAAVLSLLGLAMVLVASSAFDDQTAFPGSAAVLPVAGVVLLLLAGTADAGGRIQLWLSAPPLQRLGALSYSWYLWHWPVLVLAAAHAERDLTVMERTACVLLSLLLAVVSYALLENPVRLLPALVRNPRTSLAMGLSLVLAALVGFQGLAATGGQVLSPAAQATAAARAQSALRVQPLPVAARLRADVVATASSAGAVTNATFVGRDVHTAARDHCQATSLVASLPSQDACWYGNLKAGRTVVLLGDSHASMWLPSLDLLGERHGFRLHHLAKTSCPAAEVVTVNRELKRPFEECTRFRSAAVARILTLRPDVVVLASSRNDGDIVVGGKRLTDEARLRAYEQGLASLLRRLAPSGARFAIVGDIPFQDRKALDCASEHPERIRDCSTPRSHAVDPAYTAAERRVARAVGATYADPTSLLCTSTTCPVVVGRLVAFFDRRHLTASFALRVAGALGTWLRL